MSTGKRCRFSSIARSSLAIATRQFGSPPGSLNTPTCSPSPCHPTNGQLRTAPRPLHHRPVCLPTAAARPIRVPSICYSSLVCPPHHRPRPSSVCQHDAVARGNHGLELIILGALFRRHKVSNVLVICYYWNHRCCLTGQGANQPDVLTEITYQLASPPVADLPSGRVTAFLSNHLQRDPLWPALSLSIPPCPVPTHHPLTTIFLFSISFCLVPSSFFYPCHFDHPLTMDAATSDFKKAPRPSEQQVVQAGGNPVQRTTTNTSKAAEASIHQHNQHGMATIADDDDRLLVRIGYTPVSNL